MTAVALVFVWRERSGKNDAPGEIHLESPVSLRRVLGFAVLFLVIQIVSTLAERYLGRLGFLGISVLGGLVSSASTSAAAANLVGHAEMKAGLAGEGVVLASVASAVINLPIIHWVVKNPPIMRRLVVSTVVLSGIGVAFLVLQEYVLRK
jgi:uncharacterized membrane protein (DUF4010 family)